MRRDIDPASMGETAKLQSEKLVIAINEITSNPWMNWNDLRIVGRSLIVEEKDWDTLHALVKTWHTDRGMMPWESKGAKIEIDKFIDLLWFRWKRAQQDLTTIGTSMPPVSKNRINFRHLDKKLFAFYTVPGRTTTITGDMGTGKTNTAINDIGAESIDMGYFVCSNVPAEEIGGLQEPKNADKYYFTTKMSKFLVFACENCIRGIEETGKPYRTIHINDETIISRSKMRQSSISYQSQKIFTQMSRHFNVHGVTVEQMEGDTPPEIVQFQSQIIKKESLNDKGRGDWRNRDWRLHYSLSNMLDWSDRRDMNATGRKTPYISYDTYGISSFDIDLNIYALFNYVMRATEDGKLKTTDQYEQMISFIKKHTGEYAITEDFLKEYVWQTYKNGERIKEAIKKNPKLKKKYSWMLPMNPTRISQMVGWDLEVGYDAGRRRVERIIDKRLKLEEEGLSLMGATAL